MIELGTPAAVTPGGLDATIKLLAHDVQTYVLIGPPGTGKTTELSRMVREASDLGWMPLIASLTKAAAREIAGRDLAIDQQRIGTLHAHAYRALGAHVQAYMRAVVLAGPDRSASGSAPVSATVTAGVTLRF